MSWRGVQQGGSERRWGASMRMKESGLEVGGGVCLLSSLEQPHPERSSGSQGLDWDCRQVPRKSSRGGIRVSLMVRTKMTRARVMATGRRREGLEATGLSGPPGGRGVPDPNVRLFLWIFNALLLSTSGLGLAETPWALCPRAGSSSQGRGSLLTAVQSP